MQCGLPRATSATDWYTYASPIERDYLPAGHGELIYVTATHQWQTTNGNACLVRMAECYIEARLQPPAE